MRAFRFLSGVAASVAALGMAVPANAQAWGWRHHEHHDHDDGAGVIAALLAGGILGAVIASASKKKQPEVVVADVPPPEVDDGASATHGAPPPREDLRYDEESATDACAAAAEEEGSHYARIAQVDRVSSVAHSGDSWQVSGTLRLSESLRDGERRMRDFRCTLREGEHPAVTVAGAAPGAA